MLTTVSPCLYNVKRLTLGLALAGVVLVATARGEPPLAPATIVVFNRDVPESVDLARFYAQKRGIERDHLVGLSCSSAEEISRDEYDATMAEPLRRAFEERKWWTLRQSATGAPSVVTNSIRFVALMKGLPLKIHAATAYPGDQPAAGPIGTRNEASIDSELSVLGAFSARISGAIPNPYFQSYKPIPEFEDAGLLLVCRLDAPTAVIVRRMITDAVETERSGLWGLAYVDRANNSSGGRETGDRWLAEIPNQLHKAGVPVVCDEASDTFPDGYPMTDCALYYGWYADNVNGPFNQPGSRFVPGAIAVHIHSYSASTLRDSNAGWTGPLVARGAAASLGNVYEPYLQLTAHLDILNDRLLHGFTLAESASMATPALSWMTVVVGDPLYRPYTSWLQLDRAAAQSRGAEWKAYHDFTIKNVNRSASEFRVAARQAASRGKNAPMLEDLGRMEAGDGNLASAMSYFEQARTIYSKRDDILRVVLAEADAWIREGKPKRALELVRSVARIVSDSPALPLLKKIEQEASSGGPAHPTPAHP